MKKIPISRTSFVAVASTLAGAILVAGCKEELIDDATFRLWCGDRLCAWQLDKGRVREAPTWHQGDSGVELVESPTVISQALKSSPRCLVFTTIADVEPSAQVTVGVDFTGDGNIDYEQPVAAVGFREVKTFVTAPRTTTPPRLFISKKGQGRAVLAQLRLDAGSAKDCAGTPVRLHDRALGDACSVGVENECKSAVCCEGVCAECCVKPRALDVDESGTVATAPEVACPNGASCKRRVAPQASSLFSTVPLQCDPGSKTRSPGAVCIADDDCASGSCEGGTATATAPPTFAAGSTDASFTPCTTDFPDAGGERCAFTQVREGRCL